PGVFRAGRRGDPRRREGSAGHGGLGEGLQGARHPERARRSAARRAVQQRAQVRQRIARSGASLDGRFDPRVLGEAGADRRGRLHRRRRTGEGHAHAIRHRRAPGMPVDPEWRPRLVARCLEVRRPGMGPPHGVHRQVAAPHAGRDRAAEIHPDPEPVPAGVPARVPGHGLAVLLDGDDRGGAVRRHRAAVRARLLAGGRMSLTVTKVDYFTGIDIGQVADSTAYAVIERHRAVADLENLHEGWHDRAKKEARETPTRLDLVWADRIPLGVPYPAQVEILRDVLLRPQLRGCAVYLDATGVGLGPYQMLKQAGIRNMHGIKITGSTGPAKQTPDGWNVGKLELVSALQIEM